jgi:hypothetical protein
MTVKHFVKNQCFVDLKLSQRCCTFYVYNLINMVTYKDS